MLGPSREAGWTPPARDPFLPVSDPQRLTHSVRLGWSCACLTCSIAALEYVLWLWSHLLHIFL